MAELDEMYQEDVQDEILLEGDDAVEEEGDPEDLDALKKKLKEMEEEAARLKAVQASAGGGGSQSGKPGAAAPIPDTSEADARSIYVGSVDYSATPEELQQLFQGCGTVNRVTILTDQFGNPKGYAYVEFLEVDAVANAVLLDNSELRGRNIKVSPKRTNIPGMKAGRGRGRGRGGRGGFYDPYYDPYAWGAPPPYFGGYGRGRGGYGPPGRGRGRGRFTPY